MAAAGCALALLLAEGGLRLAARWQPCLGRPCVQEAGHGVSGHRYLHDLVLGWRNIPGHRAETWGHSLSINALGLRGDEVTRAKPAGVRRILLLGDSFIWGLGVGNDSTISAALGRRLAEINRPHQVLNAAVSGWSTDQQYLYFKGDGAALQPDLVVVGFFQLNDTVELLAPRMYGLAKPVLKGPELEVAGAPLPLLTSGTGPRPRAMTVGPACGASAICRLAAWGALSRPALLTWLSSAGLIRLAPFTREELKRDAVDLALEIFAALNRRCQEVGATLVVMKFGAFLHTFGEDKLRDFVLRDQATRLERGIADGIPTAHYLDFDAALRGRGLALQDVTLAEDRYHWNARGHAEAARGLSAYLLGKGLLGEAR